MLFPLLHPPISASSVPCMFTFALRTDPLHLPSGVNILECGTMKGLLIPSNVLVFYDWWQLGPVSEIVCLWIHTHGPAEPGLDLRADSQSNALSCLHKDDSNSNHFRQQEVGRKGGRLGGMVCAQLLTLYPDDAGICSLLTESATGKERDELGSLWKWTW